MREDFRQGEKFFPRRTIAGDVLLGHAAAAHHAPDIMVGRGEELPGVTVVQIFRQFFDVGVIVRIDYRQVFDRLEDVRPRRIAQQIILVQKSHVLLASYGQQHR
ncbi:hypothetical protein SDC9_209780 [bioreactor metagenome]|uniref:Uncharacterized protein n=1 Tax=bioreactor metagenome TaxID=1076179 RepID=A0A645JNZ7_9ZZZZ